MKERVVDEYYDPVLWIRRKLTGRRRTPLPVINR